MRHDLLRLFRDGQDFTHVIILTHNIDFLFLESVVVSELKRCGHPKLTVFADARCAATTYAYQAPLLDKLGLRYRVVPVALKPGFCFHPKAIFLSGTQKALLLIGSGNLTFGGWRENAEVWVLFNSEIDGTGIFVAFQNYLRDVLDLIYLSDPIKAELDEAFDGSTREWARSLEPPSGLLGKAGRGEILLTQLLDYLGDEPVRRLTVCSPYFDQSAEVLVELVKNLKPKTTEILVQNRRTGLNRAMASSLSNRMAIRPIRLKSVEEEGERERFLHAKFYAVELSDRVVVLAGSANCSHAAWTIPGASGNAELLAVQNLTVNEYRENYLTELEFLEGEAKLPEEIVLSPDEADQRQKAIQLLAARYDDGLLRLGFICAEQVFPTGCMVDNVRHELEVEDAGLVKVKVDIPPKQVAVIGLDDGKEVFSNTCWVDHESQLRQTARIRSLVGTIRTRIVSGQWNLGAWTEVLEMLFKHMHYMPVSSLPPVSKDRDKVKESRTYTESDVFASGYGLHFPHRPEVPMPLDWPNSFQKLLLRWLGLGLAHDKEVENGEREIDHPEPTSTDREGLPEELKLPELLPSQPESSERERMRAEKLLAQVIQWMSSEDYLKNRQPELLAVDIRITSAMLRAALREGWVNSEEFYRYTRQLWLSLFFTSEADQTRGWLDHRFRSWDPPEDFAARMASPVLSAALAAWALGVSAQVKTPEFARFRLACVLAVARLPWLWRGGPEDAIADELQKILELTGDGDKEKQWKNLNDQWVKLMRQGEALRRLEIALNGRQPKDLRHVIRQDAISAGELLWQGRSGFLVAKSPTLRSSDESVRLLYLQTKPASPAENKPDEADWSKEGKRFLVPLRALLDEAVIPISEQFGKAERQELAELLDELAQGFSVGS